MNCIEKDSSKCTVDSVNMFDDGNFGADLTIPSSVKANTTQLRTSLYNALYNGERIYKLNITNVDLEDLFDQDDGSDDIIEDTDDLFFPDGDDGQYIDDEDKPDGNFPWEIVRRDGTRRRLNATEAARRGL